jgi:hypothetical protein
MRPPRLWVAALAWLLIVAGCALASPLWRSLDWWLFARSVRAAAPPLNDALALVDVPYDPNTGRYRERLIDLLAILGQPENRPRVVLLDIEFVPEQPHEAELAAALSAFRASAKSDRCDLYAVVVPMSEGGAPDPEYATRLPRKIYEGSICGQGHTIFRPAFGVLKYDPLYAIDDRRSVPALVVRIAEDHFNRPHDTDERPIVVRLGDSSAVERSTVRFDPEQRRLLPAVAGFSLRDRVVMIGSPGRDKSPLDERISNPQNVLWALSARSLSQDSAEARLLVSPWLLLFLVLASGAIVTGVARWVYQALPRSHSRPWLLAAAPVAAALLLLALLRWALSAANLLLAQVTLPALAAVVAAGAALIFVRIYLRWRSQHPELPPLADEYDLFVSYSRTDPRHAQWVRSVIVVPIRQARRPDGRTYSVFFDTDDIRAGETWIERMFHAIDASRFFLPVYSSDYFDKPYCRREIAHAFKYQQVGRTYMIPVDCVGAEPPSPYSDVQAIRVSGDDHEVTKAVIAAMERGLKADAAAKAAAPDAAGAAPLKAG